ncbi:MAG: CtkA family protein [Eubacteriales bacterium]
MENFNEYKQNQRMYGGTAGRKMGIDYKGDNYILKFPGNLKELQMKNIQLSYSNSPVCEYIGSNIYQIFGIDVHETILGIRNDKVVTACKDFLEDADRLYEFDKIKVTFEPRFLDSNGHETNGVGLDLYEILMTIDEHPFIADIKDEVQAHFWRMFIVDALIGNADRNNSNWGIILRKNGTKEIAPVYDNGNCLNCKWDDDKMQVVLNDEKLLKAEAFTARRCIFEINGKKINPYHLIQEMKYEGCNEELVRLVPNMRSEINRVYEMICSISVLSKKQKEFYSNIIRKRFEEVIIPVYEKLALREQNVVIEKERGR